MKRRDFVGICFLTASVLTGAALSQPSGLIPRVAVLMPNVSSISRGAFDRALRNLNWIDGRNVRIEYQDAGANLELLRTLAKDSVQLHPDVIVALNTPLVAAVLDETRTIPVVFGLVGDPLGSGFIQSFARPGGNAPGFAYGGSDLASKWLGLLKEISPTIIRVGVLFNPDAAPGGGAYYVHPFEATAPSVGITPVAAPVRNAGEIERVMAELEGQPPSGLVVRVPARRAAAALTRLTRWASGLSCGRQDVPADRVVDPRYIVTKHRVEDGDDLTHHSDEDDLGFLAGGREAIVEGSELGIATTADQSRHVQHAPHLAADTTLAPSFTTFPLG